MSNFTPTIAQSAEALRQVRANAAELDVNLFLCAIERHYGTDHMKAAHKLAGEIAQAAHDAEQEGTATCGQVYIGYALMTEKHGYVTVTRDFFTHGLCFWPCSDQKSPSMAFDSEGAGNAAAWLNTTFPDIGATVKPIRYCDGAWIDQP